MSLLDQKRSLNVSIFLKQFRSTPPKIIDDMIGGDTNQWNLERVNAADKLFGDLHSNGELETVKEFVADSGVDKLPLPESFLYEVSQRFKSAAEFNLRLDLLKQSQAFAEHMNVINNAYKTGYLNTLACVLKIRQRIYR